MKSLKRLIPVLLAIAVAASLLAGGVSALAASAAPDESLALTEEELAYIGSCGTLRVGYVQDRVPISFTGADGELAGVSRRIFDRIQQLSGLRFEYVPLPAGDVTYQYLMEQELSLVTSVEFNRENQNARGILISNPYLSGRKVVVAREDLAFSFDAPLSIALSTGSQTIRKVLEASYPNFSLEDYESIDECFRAVRSGDADMMILNQHVAEYWLYKPAYENLKVIPVLGMDDLLCFSAVVPYGPDNQPVGDEGYTLIAILNKAIGCLRSDEVDSYTIEAVMANRYSFTLADFIYRYRYTLIVFSASAVLVAVLVVLLMRQRMLSVRAMADAAARSQFLSTMSHEVRTPLNGLIGLNYLMSRKLDDKEQLAKYLEQSTATAKYLLSLVSDILDMSMLHNEEVQLEEKPVHLDTLLTAVEAVAGSEMEQKGLRFSMEARLPWPQITGDGVRIQQVLLNLLDNARKFTPEGGSVSVSAGQTLAPDGRVRTEIRVSDTGRGMSETFKKNIFDTFAQERDTVSKGDQGVGLGLSICHRLAKLMDGGISFTSELGKGSEFIFFFLAPQAGKEDPEAQDGGRTGPVKVLVVEDNELNGEIMLELLEDNGQEAVLAVNGREALERFSNSRPGEYGVILMDLLMPEMDGFAAAAAIRALDRADAKTVRILACSANCTAEDRERAIASGMDDFLPKPVEIETLLQNIRK